MDSHIECRLTPIEYAEQIEHDWCALQRRTQCSYFLSWSWIGTWIRQLPIGVQPMLFTALESGRVVGLAIVVSRPVTRHGILRSNAVFLNTTGDSHLDEITIEYNGFLTEPSHSEAVSEAAFNFFLSSRWDEVFLDAASVSESLLARAGATWNLQRQMTWRTYGVELRQLRESDVDYLSILSANARRRLRRAQQAYGQLGPFSIRSATSLDEAQSWLSELSRLHQIAWTSKGFPGAFSRPLFVQFHRAMVAKHFAHDEIQLLRVAFGDSCLGYLYNFRWNGEILNYQSGLDYNLLPQDNWPGGVVHFAAIEFNRLLGAHYYDFLGGDNQLKRTLATASRPLDWVVARRKTLKFRLEDGLRSAHAWSLRIWRGKSLGRNMESE